MPKFKKGDEVLFVANDSEVFEGKIDVFYYDSLELGAPPIPRVYSGSTLCIVSEPDKSREAIEEDIVVLKSDPEAKEKIRKIREDILKQEKKRLEAYIQSYGKDLEKVVEKLNKLGSQIMTEFKQGDEVLFVNPTNGEIIEGQVIYVYTDKENSLEYASITSEHMRNCELDEWVKNIALTTDQDAKEKLRKAQIEVLKYIKKELDVDIRSQELVFNTMRDKLDSVEEKLENLGS